MSNQSTSFVGRMSMNRIWNVLKRVGQIVFVAALLPFAYLFLLALTSESLAVLPALPDQHREATVFYGGIAFELVGLGLLVVASFVISGTLFLALLVPILSARPKVTPDTEEVGDDGTGD